MRMLCGTILAAVAVAAGLTFGAAGGDDVVIENMRLKLTIGSDAIAKSLVVKSTGEELLDLRDPTPFFSVTQERPFNNEIKLAHPNVRTTYPANRIRRDGKRVVAYWHTFGCAKYALADDAGTVIEAEGLKYFETSLPADAVRTAFANATVVHVAPVKE